MKPRSQEGFKRVLGGHDGAIVEGHNDVLKDSSDCDRVVIGGQLSK